MSDVQGPPWSTGPNAPNITYDTYFAEKTNFAGIVISAIIYGMPETPTTYTFACLLTLPAWPILGITIILFFYCMTALFNPANRKREGIKWGLVSYTAAMFSFVTI